MKEYLNKESDERIGCHLALGREDLEEVMRAAFKHPRVRERHLKGSPSILFLLLLQIEPFPKGALDFRVHFLWFPFLNHL